MTSALRRPVQREAGDEIEMVVEGVDDVISGQRLRGNEPVAERDGQPLGPELDAQSSRSEPIPPPGLLVG